MRRSLVPPMASALSAVRLVAGRDDSRRPYGHLAEKGQTTVDGGAFGGRREAWSLTDGMGGDL